MAFYKKFQSRLNDLWYLRAITTGVPITTDKVADKLSLLSTVTRGDTYAVMKNLGVVLADYMAQGRTVKIDGVGTFYYTAATNKKGVATPEEVSAAQINGVRVRFIPEVGRNSGKQVVTRSMVDADITWTDIEKMAGSSSAPSAGDNTGGSGSGDGQNENPLG